METQELKKCSYPNCQCEDDPKYMGINCTNRLQKQNEMPIGTRFLLGLIMIIIALCLALLTSSCRSTGWCPAYSSATYNASQPKYPGKVNPIRPYFKKR